MSQGFFRPVWAFPVAGIVTAFVFTMVPGHALSLDQWPASGPFGAFTWGAFVVSAGLSLTLVLVALERRRRSRKIPRGDLGLGRVLATSGLFGLLAVLAFLVAARIDFLESHPSASMGLALAALAILGTMTQRLSAPTEDSEIEAVPLRRRSLHVAKEGYKPFLGFILIFGGFWLLVLLGISSKWMGPAFADVLTLQRPTVIYWSESAYFDDEAFRLTDPKSDVEQTRFRILPEGSKVEVKGWVDGGFEVAVTLDPNGICKGEWGYIRSRDIITPTR